ncbi:transcriptional regulator, AraC family [Roseivivax lentus]|uniref:Transcriptional regulator, AraC family n=1 Tax=Roseivivax lentus TaxID=633194 RepID=A0A1N7N8R6_9RHOB|nr:helix-turn-helix domain-containing protein [Roseivivax lentus]SIS94722.1 transcriptional regulator, AraC family [Roseivivax lentus]
MPSRIPTFELYGELLSGEITEPLHHETIRERSDPLGWTIRMHRHARLAQIFLFRTPGVEIAADEIAFRTTGPTLLMMPPGAAHGFRFPVGTEGDVVSLAMAALDPDTRARFDRLTQGGAVILLPDTARHFDRITELLGQVRAVFGAITAERGPLLAALARLIVLYAGAEPAPVTGRAASAPRTEQTRHEAQAQAFCAAVEEGFAEDRGVDEYARALGISAPHLTRLCRRILGAPPKAIIRQRRMVEARRLLQFTRHAIADIALRSGFHDTGYFSRAFKAETGMTPSEFRQRHGA